ncbi:hypothetical protein B0H34DRAFT_859478 [Crassisporium funariophilum]|nr:hypothetical protein B0H34DRAFT_859478 [Crassisporium funariophilum]
MTVASVAPTNQSSVVVSLFSGVLDSSHAAGAISGRLSYHSSVFTIMATIPQLPAETLEEIIDHLHDDRLSLLACSFASSKLIAACRYHLFSEVALKSPEDMDSLLQLLDVEWGTVAVFISRLIIKNGNANRSRCSTPSPSPLSTKTYTIRDPTSLVAKLSGVFTIRFVNLSFAGIPAHFWSLLNTMKSIRAVEASQMMFNAHFFGFVCRLPMLETLSILQCPWDQAPNSPSIEADGVSKLLLPRRDADLPTVYFPILDAGMAYDVQDFTDMSMVFKWMLTQCPVPLVRTLRVALDCGPCMLDSIKRYLEIAGDMIQELHIVLPTSFVALRNMDTTIDFSSCINLRAVHIEGLNITHQTSTLGVGNVDVFFQTLFLQLFSPPHPLLRKITISLDLDFKHNAYSFFGIPDYVALQAFSWCSLPRVLEETLQSLPGGPERMHVGIKICGKIAAKDRDIERMCIEENLKGGLWRGFSERDSLDVEFLRHALALDLDN